MSEIDRMIDKNRIDIHIDLNSTIIIGGLMAVIGALNSDWQIACIGALLMFGRKGLDKAVEIVKIIYANKTN